jgi:hypothetical protein
MSYLKEKSRFNMDAAQYLQKQSLYAPSVHCSYYGCLQFLKHIVNTKAGISYDAQEDERNRLGQKTNVYLINKVKMMISVIDPKESRTFNNEINQLKDLRVDSDYHNVQIDSAKANNAYTKACNILLQLKTTLKV